MNPTHVSFSIQEQHNPQYQIQQRFRQLLEEAERLSIDNFALSDIRTCTKNVEVLSQLKQEARNIAKEHRSYKDRLSKIFQICCLDISGSHWSVQDECRRTCVKIEQLITNNSHAVQFRCQGIVADPGTVAKADDVIYAFIWGAQSKSRQLHYRKELRKLYFKIVKNVRHGHYTLKEVRTVAHLAASVIPDYQLVTTVNAGKVQYVFHDLLLLHQLRKVEKDHPTKLSFETSLDVHPAIIENFYQMIEEGVSPTFKGFKEKGAIRFLQASVQLMASPEIITEGLFLLNEKSAHLQLKIYHEFVRVTCTGHSGKETLEHIVTVNEARPISSLNLAFSGIAPTIEVLEKLSAHFHHLQVLECTPYSTAGEEYWYQLFNLPCLKKVIVHLSDEDEEYLSGLLKAIENHPKPPKIHVKNGVGVSHGMLSKLLKTRA